MSTSLLSKHLSAREECSPLGLSVSEVLELISAGLFSCQLSGERMVVFSCISARVAEVFGLLPEEVKGDAGLLIDRIDPADIDLFFSSARVSAKTLSLWHSEFRIRSPKREETWVEWRAKPELRGKDLFWRGILVEITERKQVERELRRLRRAIDVSADGIEIMDDHLRFIDVNQAACQTLGYRREELLGMSPLDLDPDTTPEHLEQYKTAASKSQFVLETYHQCKDGSTFPVEVIGNVFEDEGKQYGIAIVRDIRERKKAEQVQARNEQAFRSLAESSPDYIMRYDREHRIRYLNDKLVRELQLTSAEEVIGRQPIEIWSDGRFLMIDEAVEEAIAKAEEVSIEFTVLENDRSIGFRQILVVPECGAEGDIIGALAFGRDITAIREPERRLRDIVDNLPGLAYSYRVDADGQPSFPFISSGIETLYGIEPKQVTGDWTLLHDMAHPEDRARIEETIAESARTLSTHHVEFRVCRPGDSDRWIEARSVPERHPDGSIVWTGVMLDITDRKQAEREMQRFRLAMDASSDAIYIIDIESERNPLIDVNHAACRMLGYSQDELQGMTPLEINPDLTPADLKRQTATQRVGMREVFETRHRTKEGRLIPVEIVANVFEEERKRYSIAIVRDISERKKAEQALAQSEQLFRSLVENLPDIVTRYDVQCRRTFVSSAFEAVTGVPAREILGKTPEERWSVLIGQRKAEVFQNHLLEVMAGRQQKEWELSWVTAEGKPAIFEFRAVPEFGSDGEVVGVLSVSRDVSAKRAMERQLRMAASVFEAAQEGILITDPEGCILDINPAFSRISGYERKAVLGKPPSLLASGFHDQVFFEKMWSCLLEKGCWEGEIINRRKNGEIFTERLDIVAVQDDAGVLQHYIGIFSDITQLKRHQQQLEHMAHHDALTGLPNRALLASRLSQAMNQALHNKKMLAVLYMDLDGFKPINDNYGHELGDRVLIEIGQRLLRILRAEDTVARIGGDEFVALLSDVSDVRECEATARHLLDTITQPIEIDGHKHTLSASVGISRYPQDHTDDADILLRYADQAMYMAKAGGRNQFLFHGTDMRGNVLNDNQMIYDLRQALEEDQISVYYQPIIEMATGRVIKAEALVRWLHPQQGLIPPSVFIPVAENAGLIHAIGELVFERAAGVAQVWEERSKLALEEHVRISINRSPRQFYHRDGIAPWLQYLMKEGIPGHLVTVEITEGLLLDDCPEVLEQLQQMRAMGITISMDDFGTGYSALSYLKKFEIDYLKIDRSFISGITEDTNDRAIVEAIIVMAKRLGIKLVAEGVETQGQADLLAAVGCDMAQGYYYAKPMPEADFLALVLGGEGNA